MLCESPTYLGAVQAFAAYRPRFVEVATDDDGMLPDDLERLPRRRRRASRLIYVMPDFQNPTGRTWSLAAPPRASWRLVAPPRRRGRRGPPRTASCASRASALPSAEVARPAGRDRLPRHVLEDLLPGAAASAGSRRRRTCSRSTSSSSRAPTCTPRRCRSGSSPATSSATTSTPTSRGSATLYRRRRDAMLRRARRGDARPGSRYTRPHGGLFLWVELPERLNARELLADCARARRRLRPRRLVLPQRRPREHAPPQLLEHVRGAHPPRASAGIADVVRAALAEPSASRPTAAAVGDVEGSSHGHALHPGRRLHRRARSPATRPPSACSPRRRDDGAGCSTSPREMNLSETAFLVRARATASACAGSRRRSRSTCAATRPWRARTCSGRRASSARRRAGPLPHPQRPAHRARGRRRGSSSTSRPAPSARRAAAGPAPRALGVDARRTSAGTSTTSSSLVADEADGARASTPDPRALARARRARRHRHGAPRRPRATTSCRASSPPASGVDEDPVTGSAHCCLAPFWRERLGRDELVGYQASARGGVGPACASPATACVLGGQAVTVARGEILA